MKKIFIINIIIIIIYCLVSGGKLLAQGIVSGKVIDSQTREAIPGVNIVIQETSQGTVTDQHGQFKLSTRESVLNLSISTVGYETLSIRTKTGEALNIRMTPNLRQLDEVIISAFEGERRLLETPAAVARLNTQDIERFNLLSPQQAFSTLPGVKIESTTIGRYTVRIRGGNLGTVGHSDNYKSYWNGIPITFADGFSPLAYFDFGNVGSLNIIRGPSGSIYGAGLSGVALFENKAPAYKETALQTDALWGSYNTHRYAAVFSTGGEKGDIRLQYSKIYTDGYREEGFSDNQYVNLSARIFPSEKQTISFITHFIDRSYGIPGNINAAQVAENPRQSNFSPEFDNGVAGKNLLVGASHEYQWNERWQNTTSFSYQVYEGTFFIGNVFFKVADQSLTTTFSLRSSTAYNFNVFWGNNGRFVFGGEFTRGINDVDDFTDGFESPIFSSRGTLDRSLLAFSQLELDLPGEMTLTLGGSFNNFYLAFEERLAAMEVPRFTKTVNDFSPRVALVKKLKDNLYLYGNVSKGFTPPPRGAIDNDGENTNTDLESTKGWNKEIGVRGTMLHDRLNFDLVLYRLDEQDVIVPRITSNVGGIDRILNENAGAIDRQGIELGARYFLVNDPTKALSLAKLWTSYTYMDHTFETYNTIAIDDNGEAAEVNYDGKKIPGVHPHTLVLGADLTTKTGFYLNTTFSYYGEIYLDNANTATDDAYRLLDMKLGYRETLFEKLQVDVYGGVNNLLDDEYNSMHSLNASFGAYYDPAPGRNYYGGMSVKYIF